MREYEINPYQLVAKEGKYYLICNNHKYDSVSNYRVDRMTDMEILPFQRRAFNTLTGSDGRPLDLKTYMEKHIYMFAGESIRAVFRITKDSLSDVIDVFGKDVKLSEETDTHIIVTADVNELAMEQFAKAYTPYIEVTKPVALREKMINNLSAGLEKYQDKGRAKVVNNNTFTENQFKILEYELEENFDLDEIELPDEYRYSSLPLCLIDAIFSIGVKYSSTKNTVARYCDYYHIHKYRDSEDYLPVEQQHTLSELIQNIEKAGTEYFADKIVKNKQRTSSQNGILKSKAVLECAIILSSHSIETLNDFRDKMNIEIEKEFCKGKGQKSGISLAYLKMLCGDPNTIKPDRHILRFLDRCFDEEIHTEDAQQIFIELIQRLRIKYNTINARQLDYLIWSFMASK